jgi:hypothetical protein
VIVRLLGEGQFRISDELHDRLNELDTQAVQALDADDADGLARRLTEMAALVKEEGERLADDELSPSDVIIPPADLSLEETRQLFHGDGLIPDLPAA